MNTYTQRGQLGLFLPADFKPAPQKWAPPTPEQREKLANLRAEFAQRAARPTPGRGRY